ncbi:MAG: pyridoxal-dependent decarboxylase [Bacteroidota bacterium]
MSRNLDPLRQAYDMDEFAKRAHHLIAQLAPNVQKSLNRDTDEVLAWQTANAFWQKGIQALVDDPVQLLQQIEDQSIRLHHPRYMGHQIAPVLPLTALAGLMSQLLNNGMGVYEMGMAGTIMEREVLEEVAAAIGYSEGYSGIMTSGGTLANLTALLAARQVQSEHDIWEDGYLPGERLAIMVSEEAHYSVQRAIKIMGWGERGIVKIPVDEAYRLRADLLAPALDHARQQGLRVIGVVGSACSTATGSFDPLDAIGAFCEAENLWFHVDAAHGGPAIFAPENRSLLRGIEKADSVLMDFHKMALCPALCTALLFKDAKDSYQTFSQKAAYLWEDPSDQEWYNLGKRTFECTKHMMSLAPFLLHRTYGFELVGTYVDQMFALGHTFGERLASADDFELLVKPACNIVCFRYCSSSASNQNELNRAIRARLRDEGRFYIVQTELKGKVYLRTALMNPFTEISDLEALMEEIRRIANSLLG